MPLTPEGQTRLDAAIERVCAVFKAETGVECAVLAMVTRKETGTFSPAKGVNRIVAAELLARFAANKSGS